MKNVLAIFALALAAGCTSLTPAPETSEPVDTSLIQRDLAAAIDMANANGDTYAAACYTAVQKNLPNVQAVTDPAVIGLFSGLEKARVIRQRIEAAKIGVPDEVHYACAGLVGDAAVTGAKLKLLGVFM